MAVVNENVQWTLVTSLTNHLCKLGLNQIKMGPLGGHKRVMQAHQKT